MTPEELAAAYAMQSPHDLHVPTLAEIFRREGIMTLEQAERRMFTIRDAVDETDALYGPK